MRESEAFFGWLSDLDRRAIRALRNPEGEGVPKEDRLNTISQVVELLNDPRNVSLVEEAMPRGFYSFRHQMMMRDGQVTSTQVMRKFLQEKVSQK